jgi:signal transduction histidine kinase
VLKPLCERKILTICPGRRADVPILQTDHRKLQQILYNFLSNAVKFSPPGGRIDLTADRSDAAACGSASPTAAQVSSRKSRG